MNRPILFLLVCGALTAGALAQNIVLKDGKVIAAKSLRRQGDTIMATVEIAATQPGQKPQTGELGYPLAQIAKLDFPEPPQLKSATDLITQGKLTEAVTQIEPVIRFYEGFRDAPGSWWADAALLKAQALVNQGREAEAAPIAEQIARIATEPETARAAKVQIAANLTRRGDHGRALEICDAVLKESIRPETLAAAAIAKGQSHLAKKEWDPALLAFLQIPVFYPDQKLLIPQSMLGSGRAYAALQDFTRARAALNDLIAAYGGSAEARQAKAELEKIEKTEKALEPPK